MSKADSKHPVTPLEITRDQLGDRLVSSCRPEDLVPQMYYMHITYYTYIILNTQPFLPYTHMYTYTNTYSVNNA